METTQVSPYRVNVSNLSGWKQWKAMALDGFSSTPSLDGMNRIYIPESDRQVRLEQVRASLCECCGGRWFDNKGNWRAAPVHTNEVTNRRGIYFGDHQTVDELRKHTGLPKDCPSFEIKDNDVVHAFVWKDE